MLININKISYVELQNKNLYEIFESTEEMWNFVSKMMLKVFEKNSINKSLSLNEWSVLNSILYVLTEISGLDKKEIYMELVKDFQDDLINIDSAYYFNEEADKKFTTTFIQIFTKILQVIKIGGKIDD